jgi:hypothetical protein
MPGRRTHAMLIVPDRVSGALRAGIAVLGLVVRGTMA